MNFTELPIVSTSIENGANGLSVQLRLLMAGGEDAHELTVDVSRHDEVHVEGGVLASLQGQTLAQTQMQLMN